MKTKKAQEEIVGFIMVVAVVAVIFIVFLAIFLRRAESEQRLENQEISQFLDTMMEFTTDCVIRTNRPASLRDAIIKCYKDGESETCTNNNEKVCEVASNTAEEIIKSSWRFNDESPYGGFVFWARYDADSPSPVDVFNPVAQGGGASSSSLRRAQKPIGNGITITLDINEKDAE